MPSDLKEEESECTIFEEIYSSVMAAFRNGGFQKDDISKICVGLLGVSCLRCSNLERMNEIVDLLEGSIRGY
jgi:hypothetical protein